uniref:Photosystem I assembly protein Ycf4 n=1 Tax=Selaginella lyallii TaxID=137159 RepID=A0A481ZKG5_9TRAC|nr:photosystem I assembly protein ycf4 [Selaginella lyallii]QBL02093.1 photosystem I assembly protein ycf4 [Selaginella lyallii]
MNQQEGLSVEPVDGYRRASHLFWACVTLLGALGFFLVGISSYLGWDITPLLPSQQIHFVPQGVVMSFYGIAGIFFSFYLWCTISRNVGSGDDRYDRQAGVITMSRWGFPGDSRRIHNRVPIENVKAIRMEFLEGIYPRSVVSMRLEGQQSIPLTRPSEYQTLLDTERRAAEPARFLGVPIEGFDRRERE